MAGRHSHYRVTRGHLTAALLTLATREAEAALLAAARQPCTCTHPARDHEPDSGCLHGWGRPPATGCTCEGTPA